MVLKEGDKVRTERNKNDLRGVRLFTQYYHMCIITMISVIFKYHAYLVYCDTPNSVPDDIKVLITKALIYN